MLVSTQGEQAGAILIQYNLRPSCHRNLDDGISGLWDVHTRIGGFAGSKLQAPDCVTNPNVTITAANLNRKCIAAYMSMHVTKFSDGLYMENNWLWTADHDLDDALNNNKQITVYAGRGLLIESDKGQLWL